MVLAFVRDFRPERESEKEDERRENINEFPRCRAAQLLPLCWFGGVALEVSTRENQFPGAPIGEWVHGTTTDR